MTNIEKLEAGDIFPATYLGSQHMYGKPRSFVFRSINLDIKVFSARDNRFVMKPVVTVSGKWIDLLVDRRKILEHKWIPNKTNVARLKAKFGTEKVASWVGKEFTLEAVPNKKSDSGFALRVVLTEAELGAVPARLRNK